MSDRDIRTLGYVLKRTNYGEADRILNLITPVGKITAIAKGVRKEKSKLAGGIEMFSLVDFNVHLGKSDFGIITGAKMLKYYGEIIKDFGRMELAAMMLRKISMAAESADNPEYFKIIDESLEFCNAGGDLRLTEAWFLMNLMRAMGEEMNLYRDVRGEKLAVEKKYVWDGLEAAFREEERGEYGANEIKMLRLILSNDLKVASRVKVGEELFDAVLDLARVTGKVK